MGQFRVYGSVFITFIICGILMSHVKGLECNQYLHLEKVINCGGGGYFLEFGKKYCDRFKFQGEFN